MTSDDEILAFIKMNKKVKPKEIENEFKLLDRTVNRLLSQLVKKKLLRKSGLGRSVAYELEPAANDQPAPPPKGTNPPVTDKINPPENQKDKTTKFQDKLDASKQGDSPKVPSILIKAKDRLEQWSNAIKSWQGFILPIMIAVGIISGPLLWVGSIIGPFFAHRHERNGQQEELLQTRDQLQLERQNSSSLQNELKQTKAQLGSIQQQLAENQNAFKSQLAVEHNQQQEREKNFEEQIKALRQQNQNRQETTVDYTNLAQHPFTNSFNLIKGWMNKPKPQENTAAAVEDKSKEIKAYSQKLDEVTMQNKDLKEELSKAKAQAPTQSEEMKALLKENASQSEQMKALLKDNQLQMDQIKIQSQHITELTAQNKELTAQIKEGKDKDDKIAALSEENKRLDHQYKNEVGISQDLQHKLEAVRALKGQISTEKHFGIRMDEDGNMVKN